MKRTHKYWIWICGAILAACAFTGCSEAEKDPKAVDFTYRYENTDSSGTDEEIPQGFFINGIDVGGKTASEALSKLKKLDEDPRDRNVILTADGKEYSTTLHRLGLAGDMEDAIDRCLSIALSGGLVRRYLTGRDVLYGTLQMEYVRSLERDKVEEFITKAAELFDQKPVNAKLAREDGEFVVTPEQNGLEVDANATMAAVLDAFNNMDNTSEDIRIEATMVTDIPAKTEAALSTVTDLLGSFTTTYLDTDRQRNDRCTNVEVATAYIDGTVLMPGESASTSDMMRDRIEENGYAVGHMYVDGVVEDAVGGGVCQVATTLYQALLRAELQIDVRKNHSMLVSYVDPSMDAAIANGSKDLVFTNNTEYPVYLCGETDGHKITFKIYGKETRDPGHKVELISVEDDRIVSEDIIVEDATMYEGQEEKTGDTHDEVRSHLVKVVYENGVEVSRETLHSDYYRPSYRTIKRGTAPLPETTAAETESTAEEKESKSGGTEETKKDKSGKETTKAEE